MEVESSLSSDSLAINRTESLDVAASNNDSDDSDDDVFNFSSRKIRKPIVVSENSNHDNNLNNGDVGPNISDGEEVEDEVKPVESRRRRVQLLDSDDSDDDKPLANKSSVITEHDSASEDEDDQHPHNTTDSESGGGVSPSGSPRRCMSEDEEEESRILETAKNVLQEKTRKVKKPSESVVRAERQKEVDTIHSESQRRVREGPISLPYHRPKQRTLQEFLNRKKQQPLPTGRCALKMSMKNIDVLRQLEARRKEVADFYKSESEDDADADDSEWKPSTQPHGGDHSDSEDEKCHQNPDVNNQSVGIKEHLDGETEKHAEETVLVVSDTDLVLDEEAVMVEENKLDSSQKDDSADLAGVTEHEENVENERSGNQETTKDDLVNSTVADISDDVSLEKGSAMDTFEDDDDFIPNLYDDASLARSAQNEKRINVNLSSEILEDEGMDNLVLLEDDDDNSFSAPVESCSVIPNALPLSKLSGLSARLTGVTLGPAPRLTPATEHPNFIDLDADFAVPRPPNPGLADLMNRYARHAATKRQLKGAQKVNMSIVSKEKDAQGKEQLVSSEVLVDIGGETEDQFSACSTPGRKLQLLKASLRATIHQQRAEATRRRQQQKNFMESEDIQDTDDPFALPVDEEEAELTESEGESEPEEDDVELSDKPREKNDFLEDEAEDEDEDDDNDNDNNDTAMDSEPDDDSDEDEVVAPKPSLCHRAKKSTLVDSDDEDDMPQIAGGLGTEADSAEAVPVPSSVEAVPVPSSVEAVPVPSSATIGHGSEALGGSGGAPNSTGVTQSAASAAVDTSLEDDDDDDDLPTTQPVGQKASPPTRASGGNPDSSILCNSSLDDSSSLELQGSCIPGHQPQRRSRRRSRGCTEEVVMHHGNSSSSLLCLPMENSCQDLLWCTVDNSSSKASATHYPSVGGGVGAIEGLAGSQELRLDFRGVTDDADQEEELVDIAPFAGAVPSLPTDSCDDTQADIANLMGLCSGQFTGRAVPAARSSPTLALTLDDSIPNLPLTLDYTSPPPTRSMDATVLLCHSTNHTEIGSTVPSHDKDDYDLLDLCSGDFTSQPALQKRSTAASKGQPKLTSFFTRSSQPNKSARTQPDTAPPTDTLAAAAPHSDTLPDAVPPTDARAATLTKEAPVADESNGDGSHSDASEQHSDDYGDKTKKRRRIIFIDDDDDDDTVSTTMGQKEHQEHGSDTELTEQQEEAEDEDESDQPRVRVYEDDEKFQGFKDRSKGGIRRDFLEAEAELSGSELGSDDEEGEDDDVMDEEEGDKEVYDEDELREEVAMTHLRGELAKDQREVRLLKEMYLEDGDLHGEGRQRSYRWKNLDRDDDGADGGLSGDLDKEEKEDEVEEEQEAAKWRQQRADREQFLKENEGKEEDCSALKTVQTAPTILKSRSVVVYNRLNRNSSVKQAIDNSEASAESVKKPLKVANPEVETAPTAVLARLSSLPTNLTKCGSSFLSRGATQLARLGSLIKERNDGSRSTATKANAGGNFVFQSLSAEEALENRSKVEQATAAAGKKRPASSGANGVIKKPRMDRALTTNSLNTSIFKHL